MLAARWGHTDTVMELVKAGAKLDLQDKVELTTPTSQIQLFLSFPLSLLRMETQLSSMLQ